MKKTNLLITTLFIVGLFLGGFENLPKEFFAKAQEQGITYEQKIYSSATLNDSFDDSTVIVLMDKNISEVNKQYEADFFGDIGIASIEDLTYISGEIEDREYFDEENFRQILRIHLLEHSKENVLSVIDELETIEGILCVEPNYYEEVAAISETDYSAQWGLNAIQADLAWDITTGSKAIKVGIIDSGIAEHSYLDDNVIEGWDFYNDNGITNDDEMGHGTHIAGIIGAKANSAEKMAGINLNISLVPLQVVYWDNAENSDKEPGWYFNSASVAQAISWATGNIPILNFSGGSYEVSNAIKSALESYDGLFVCSAGNGIKAPDGSRIPQNTDVVSYYPSIYADEDSLLAEKVSFNRRTISVGALEIDSARSSFSNYGKNTVSIYAPGGNIYSTLPDGDYGTKTGTSMAAPHVSGVAALMLSVNPNLTGEELKNAILNSADTISIDTPDGTQTVKKLNAYKAVQDVELTYAYTTNVYEGEVIITGVETGGVLPHCVKIPEQIIIGDELYPVTAIANEAFKGQALCEEFVMHMGIKSIGADAFKNTGVWNQTENNSVVYTSLIEENELNAVWAVGVKGTLGNAVQLPLLIMGIADETFIGQTNLRSISLFDIPIGEDAFIGCENLTAYSVAEPDSFANTNNMAMITGFPVFWNCTMPIQLNEDPYITQINKTADNMTDVDQYATDPYRQGYMFAGWYANPVFTGTSYTTAQLGWAPNGIYYAKWVVAETYTITYRDVGGTEFSGTYSANSPTTHTYGIETKLRTPTKEHYRFLGWYTNSEGEGVPITKLDSMGYKSNITLYAKWEPETYAITYFDLGGSTFTGEHSLNYPTIHTYGEYTYLGIPTKTDCTFDGWYTNSIGTGAEVSVLLPTHAEEVTLYAKWVSNNGGCPKVFTNYLLVADVIPEICLDYFKEYAFTDTYFVGDPSSFEIDDLQELLLVEEYSGILFYASTQEFLEKTQEIGPCGLDTNIPCVIATNLLLGSGELSMFTFIRDYYSMGYNIASTYVNALTENNVAIMEIVQTLYEDLGYFPIVGGYGLKGSTLLLMGMSDVLGAPVKVLYEHEILSELDDYDYSEFNYWLFVNATESCLPSFIDTNDFYFFGYNEIEMAQFLTVSNNVFVIREKTGYLQMLADNAAMGTELDISMLELWEFDPVSYWYDSGYFTDNTGVQEEYLNYWLSLSYPVDETTWYSYRDFKSGNETSDSWDNFYASMDNIFYIEMVVIKL